MKSNLDYTLISTAYLYLIIPIVIFFFGWLAWYYAVVGTVVVLATLFYCLKDFKYYNDSTVKVKFLKNQEAIFRLVLVVIGLFIWVAISGIGGYGLQNSDFHARNAIFHDLINRKWPVVYDFSATQNHGSSGALVYYFAYWLPSALIGKLMGWKAANLALYLWTVLGVALSIALLLRYIKKNNILTAFIGLVFFSGLDIVGHVILNKSMPGVGQHIEFWASKFQYSSDTTQLFWVFNQAVPAWITTLLLLNCKDKRFMFFTYFLVLPFAPFAFVGLFPYVLYLGFYADKGKTIFEKVYCGIRHASTWQNILAPVTILTIFGLFFSCNEGSGRGGYIFDHGVDKEVFLKYILFMILEFLIYSALIFRYYKKNVLFYISVISLILMPLYNYGMYNDFVMRASIPALLILLVFILNYIIDSVAKIKNIVCVALLVIAFCIGAATPYAEQIRSIKAYNEDGKVLVADDWKSFVTVFDKGIPDEQKRSCNNYVSTKYSDSLFAKLAKK